MFCMHCGADNAPDDRFCARCGANLHEDADATMPIDGMTETDPVQTAAQPTEPAKSTEPAAPAEPIVQQPSEPAPAATAPAEAPQYTPEPGNAPAEPAAPTAAPAAATAAPAATVARPRRGWVKPVVITLVVALIAGGCGLGAFLTWRAGIWGGKIMPNPSDFTPAAGQSLTADIVAKQLNDKGIATQIKQVYAAQPKGQYAGIEGAQPGDRIQNGQTVTVKSSLGPGVPEGTVGKTAAEAQDALKDMGVPVTVKKLVVADDSTVPEGSVVATSPADGQALPDDQKSDGIFVGVASKGDGIPYDILGKDIDTVKSQLEAKGYTVDVQDRLARKDYIGKVSGSDPAPGSDASGSKTVTLYRGIDGKDAKKPLEQNVYGMTATWGSPYTLAGRYCTKGGKCLAFTADTTNAQATSPLLSQTEGSTSAYKDQNYNGATGTLMVACDAVQQPYCSSMNAQYLINGDTGAFELFPQSSLSGYMCGTTLADNNGVGQMCINGQLQTVTDYSARVSGATYEMDDLYLVVPAGADLDKLKSSGYFDDAALKDADGKPAVDTTRPFIVARDKSLYDSTSAPYDPLSGSGNPFLPFAGYGTDNHVKMKPAPTDDNVYYLVDNADMDWKSLPNAD